MEPLPWGSWRTLRAGGKEGLSCGLWWKGGGKHSAPRFASRELLQWVLPMAEKDVLLSNLPGQAVFQHETSERGHLSAPAVMQGPEA